MCAELMLMGFISLTITILQEPVSKVCIPSSAYNKWTPCDISKRPYSATPTPPAPPSLPGYPPPQEEHRRRLLASGSSSTTSTVCRAVHITTSSTTKICHINCVQKLCPAAYNLRSFKQEIQGIPSENTILGQFL